MAVIQWREAILIQPGKEIQGQLDDLNREFARVRSEL